MKQVFLFIFLAFVSTPLCAFGQLQPLPPLTASVVDLANIISPEDRESLAGQLAGVKQQYGVQIAVLTVLTTQPETIEQYAVRVFESWKLGAKSRDDGLLLVVAKNDKRVRFEVGYGVEGAIPDVVARRIIDARLTPAFREGKFSDGISAAVDAIGKVIGGSGEFKADAAPEKESLGFLQLTMIGIFAGAFVAGLSKYIGMGAGGIVSGFLGLTSGLSWPLILASILLSAAGVAIFAGAPAMGGRGGRFGGGGFGGWSGGGGFGGGSIFTGGGGRSGGGGASGGW